MKRARLQPTPPPHEGLGRGSPLSDEMRLRFCKLIRKGLPADGACDYLGISPTTFYGWMNKGKRWVEGGRKPKELEPYGLFVAAFRRATAAYRKEMTDLLHNVPGPGAWVRYMAILERRDRKTWSRDEQSGGDEDVLQPDEKFE